MKVSYSLRSLQRISDSSRDYAEKMRTLQENITLEWLRKVRTECVGDSTIMNRN